MSEAPRAESFTQGWFDPLWDDHTPDADFFAQRPLLAHYTTMAVLENILRTNEVWFSNPLLMNDFEEVRFGINEGTDALLRHEGIKAELGDSHRIFEEALLSAHSYFDTKHAFDTYVLCLSQHDEDDTDGVLSMWRGYGDGGKGVAIVFDARELAEAKNSPLIISKVIYGTQAERLAWFTGLGDRFVLVLRDHAISSTDLPLAVAALLSRLRAFSLFSKHVGFKEEREWRLAYQPELDPEGGLRKYLGYFNGPRGVEPKLKLPIKPIPEIADSAPFSLEKIVRSILLGPSISSVLTQASTQRMLTLLGRPELASRVRVSGIPFRSTS